MKDENLNGEFSIIPAPTDHLETPPHDSDPEYFCEPNPECVIHLSHGLNSTVDCGATFRGTGAPMDVRLRAHEWRCDNSAPLMVGGQNPITRRRGRAGFYQPLYLCEMRRGGDRNYAGLRGRRGAPDGRGALGRTVYGPVRFRPARS